MGGCVGVIYGREFPCMDVEYRCVCYSMQTSVIRQSPKLACAQTVGLVAEASLHLITQASRVFPVHTRDFSCL